MRRHLTSPLTHSALTWTGRLLQGFAAAAVAVYAIELVVAVCGG